MPNSFWGAKTCFTNGGVVISYCHLPFREAVIFLWTRKSFWHTNSKVSRFWYFNFLQSEKSSDKTVWVFSWFKDCAFLPESWSLAAMLVGIKHPLLGLSKLRLVLFAPWRFLHHNLPGCFRLLTHSTSSTSPWSRATNLLGENCPFYAFIICSRSILILFYVQNLTPKYKHSKYSGVVAGAS